MLDENCSPNITSYILQLTYPSLVLYCKDYISNNPVLLASLQYIWLYIDEMSYIYCKTNKINFLCFPNYLQNMKMKI